MWKSDHCRKNWNSNYLIDSEKFCILNKFIKFAKSLNKKTWKN